MKIDMNFSNYFRCFNEAEGIAMAKQKIIKSKNPQVTTYLQNIFLIFSFVLLASLFLLVYKYEIAFNLVFFFDIVFLLLNIVYILERNVYGPPTKGSTSITKDGIVNNTYKDIEMHFPWEIIQAVVIKKYTITILTNTSCYFFFDISKKEKIIKLLKKYKKENLLIGA